MDINIFLLLERQQPRSTLFPYTTLFRSAGDRCAVRIGDAAQLIGKAWAARSEEHTSELQSRENLVCRLLLEKKKIWRDCDSIAARAALAEVSDLRHFDVKHTARVELDAV